MLNERIKTGNYFPDVSELEDTKNKNDYFLEYYSQKDKQLVRKYVKENMFWTICESRSLYDRFLKGEDVHKELNRVYSKLGEPEIENLKELLENRWEILKVKENTALNKAKSRL